MNFMKTAKAAHPAEREIADYLDRKLDIETKSRIEGHIASCPCCLASMVSAYESVKEFEASKKRKGSIMNKMNIYLILAVISFLLSFVIPRYFAQFLVAAAILSIKWISDAKSVKMLVMIYDAWKNGGEKEASRTISTLLSGHKKRF